MYRFLVSFLALLTLAAGEPTVRSRQEALERFRKMSPKQRLRQVSKAAHGRQAFVAAKRADLDVMVVERGTLEPAKCSDVYCTIRSPHGTVIKWIIQDGTLVKKGDRLIELDDSAVREKLKAANLDLEKARADRSTAEETVKLLQAQQKLDILSAEVRLKQAKIALKKFKGKDPDERELLALKVEQAQVGLDLAKLKGKGKVVQAAIAVKSKAAIEAQQMQVKREIEAELSACILKAPQDGLAVYYVPPVARDGRPPWVVGRGESVEEGQKLMRVCSLDRFVAITRVHEELVGRLYPVHSQAATVRVDAFLRKTFQGKVKSVDTVAWTERDAPAIPTYKVVVDITDEVAGLKPGMSAELRIKGEHLPKVLLIPLASVLRIGRETYCYVKTGRGLSERKVKTAGYNDLAVEITAGLKEKDLVLRDPRAVAGAR